MTTSPVYIERVSNCYTITITPTATGYIGDISHMDNLIFRSAIMDTAVEARRACQGPLVEHRDRENMSEALKRALAWGWHVEVERAVAFARYAARTVGQVQYLFASYYGYHVTTSVEELPGHATDIYRISPDGVVSCGWRDWHTRELAGV